MQVRTLPLQLMACSECGCDTYHEEVDDRTPAQRRKDAQDAYGPRIMFGIFCINKATRFLGKTIREIHDELDPLWGITSLMEKYTPETTLVPYDGLDMVSWDHHLRPGDLIEFHRLRRELTDSERLILGVK